MSNGIKNNFVAGLITGIVITGVVGFLLTSGGILKGNQLADVSKTAADEENNQLADEENIEGALVNIEVSESDHIRGDVNAPITIVEFSDFQCPYCSRFHTTMKEVMAAYPSQVRWVYRHFPLDQIHPFARKAAEASECASDQGKFWEYADKLYESQSGMNDDTFSKIASELGLNTTEFESCVSSEKYKAKVEADLQTGISNGVQGTPGSFINDQSVPGALPLESIKAIIDAQLGSN